MHPCSIHHLRLSPLEEYFYFNDSPEYPMTIAAVAHLKGRLDPNILSAAAREAVARHPLLHARIVRSRTGRLFWETVPDFLIPRISWFRGLPTDRDRAPLHMDLRCGPGLGIRAYENGQEHGLLYYLHHCCTDGLGAFQFIEDMIAAYIRLSDGRLLDHRRWEPKPELLDSRSRLGMTRTAWLKRILSHRFHLKSMWGYHMKTPAVLFPLRRIPSGDVASGPAPGLVRRFTVEQTRSIRLRARSSRTHLNAYLVSSLFSTIARWRHGKGLSKADDCLRICIPVNLRTRKTLDMPACNLSGPLFFTDTVGELLRCNDPLFHITRKIAHEAEIDAVFTFMLGLNLYQKIPGLLAGTVRKKKCPTTAFLSNVGKLLRRWPQTAEGHTIVGGFRIVDLECFAPVWPNTQAMLLTYEYAGCLHLTLVYDRNALTIKDAEGFLDVFMEHLLSGERMIDAQGPANPDIPSENLTFEKTDG